ARGWFASQLAQHANGIGNCELLAGETGNKAASAYFSSALKLAVATQQLAPWGQPVGLALKQSPEHDPIALQQRARHMLDCVRFGRHRRRAAGERPPARVFRPEHHGSTSSPTAGE